MLSMTYYDTPRSLPGIDFYGLDFMWVGHPNTKCKTSDERFIISNRSKVMLIASHKRNNAYEYDETRLIKIDPCYFIVRTSGRRALKENMWLSCRRSDSFSDSVAGLWGLGFELLGMDS